MRVDLDPATPGVQASVPFCVSGTVSHVSIKLPPLKSGMHRFEAALMLDGVGDETSNLNNSAEAVTVVRGRTRVLYVESGGGADASLLPDALAHADIEVDSVDRISPEFFPREVSQLQGYDAVVLANVQRGVEGLNLDQERALVRYVRDLGGGLVVVGGPHALGAGQWEGSELEAVLPIDMRPAQRHSTAPGALVIVVDRSGSMADPLAGGQSKLQAANSAALRAMESLSPRDRVGVIAFNQSPEWTIPLTQKRKCNDVPLRLAATSPQGGTAIGPALDAACDALARLSPDEAGVRHVLLMTDGVSEPADYDAILSKMTAAKITLSTVAVGGDADCILLGQLARHGGGFAYNAGDANHLCDAFVHDAVLLRRPMILESPEGIAVVADPRSSGISGVQGLRLGGMVLSSVKPAANVEVLLRAAGPDGDPVLTRWQCGLGQTAVFAGDATARWGRGWVKSKDFSRFWPQLVRSVARGGANSDFDVRTVRDGPRTRIIVEAIDGEAAPQRFLAINGKLAGPDARKPGADVRLSQTGPGTYEATMDTPDAGTYCATLAVQSGAERRGTLVAAVVVNAAAELRDLQSNDALLARVALQTGGRVLGTFDRSADLFSREGLQPSVSSQPIDHLLLPMLMSILLADVAVRRLAWDWQRMRWLAGLAVGHVRGFFAMRSAESVATLAALRQVRGERARQKFSAPIDRETRSIFCQQPAVRELPISRSAAPEPRGYVVSLMAAKQRAREQIHQIEQDAKRQIGPDRRD